VTDHETRFVQTVGRGAARKLATMSAKPTSTWSRFGMLGIIGWSVVLPTLFGALLGTWIERRWNTTHPWTLALLVAGLLLGCCNVWRWMAAERAVIETASEPVHDGQTHEDQVHHD
jgi:ATP synthase protein I